MELAEPRFLFMALQELHKAEVKMRQEINASLKASGVDTQLDKRIDTLVQQTKITAKDSS